MIPAIDLMKGQVVRLQQGDPDRATFYNALGNPIQIAELWKNEGARYLHIVDLDAAIGTGNNRSQIRMIIDMVKLPLEVGGGIRTVEDVRLFINLGVDRVILGTAAMEQPELLVSCLSECGSDKIAVALDYLGTNVMTRGWTKYTGYSVESALSRLVEVGVRTFILTCISRDGSLTGPDLETLARCARLKSINILAAGGVGSLEDLQRLKNIGVKGVVVGKALYEGRIRLSEVLSII